MHPVSLECQAGEGGKTKRYSDMQKSIEIQIVDIPIRQLPLWERGINLSSSTDLTSPQAQGRGAQRRRGPESPNSFSPGIWVGIMKEAPDCYTGMTLN